MNRESEQFVEGQDFFIVGGVRYWSPARTADKLGISTAMLAYRRRQKKIKGLRLGDSTNIFVYSDEEIRLADLSPEKPGPKVREGSRLGRAKYVWPEDEKGREMQPTGDDKDRLEWRLSGHRAPQRLLVGA